jgi:hypothetical protein
MIRTSPEEYFNKLLDTFSLEDVGHHVTAPRKFYSREWSEVRQGHTDAAIKAAW